MADGNFDVSKFVENWGKCLDDIRACNKLTAGSNSAEQAKQKINSAKEGIGFPPDLGKILSAIQSITPFLNHHDENVREDAANALATLLIDAVKCLNCETDPETIMSASKILLEAIDKLQTTGLIPARILAAAKQAINKKQDGIFNPDQFVSSKELQNAEQNDTNGKSNLPDGFKKKFLDSINHVRGNLIGNTSYNQFTKSHNKTMKTLIGEG